MRIELSGLVFQFLYFGPRLNCPGQFLEFFPEFGRTLLQFPAEFLQNLVCFNDIRSLASAAVDLRYALAPSTAHFRIKGHDRVDLCLYRRIAAFGGNLEIFLLLPASRLEIVKYRVEHAQVVDGAFEAGG